MGARRVYVSARRVYVGARRVLTGARRVCMGAGRVYVGVGFGRARMRVEMKGLQCTLESGLGLA